MKCQLCQRDIEGPHWYFPILVNPFKFLVPDSNTNMHGATVYHTLMVCPTCRDRVEAVYYTPETETLTVNYRWKW